MTYVEKDGKIAFHPAYYIKEYMDFKGMSKQELATKLNITYNRCCRLIDGEVCIDYALATKLSRLIGTSVEYWLNLQEAFIDFLDDSEID